VSAFLFGARAYGDFWLAWFNVAGGFFTLIVGLATGFDLFLIVLTILNLVIGLARLLPLSYRGAS